MEWVTEWIGGFLAALKLAIGALVFRAMAALGLAWVSFDYVLPDVKGWLSDQAAVLPADAVQWLSALGVDIFMVLVLSALVAKIGFQVMLVGVDKLEQLIGNAGG